MVQYFGILNVTPDSFSDGGRFVGEVEENEAENNNPLSLSAAPLYQGGASTEKVFVDKAIEAMNDLFGAGADFVDVGGQSTRPGAEDFGWEKEWSRVKEILEGIKQQSNRSTEPFDNQLLDFSKISLDTKNHQTARKFMEMGGRIINDVSGFQDPGMMEVGAEMCGQIPSVLRTAPLDPRGANTSDPLFIVNHFPGETIEDAHEQKIDSINQVVDELCKKRDQMISAGINSDSIVLDPGIGFGKTMALNWQLLEFPVYVENFSVMIGSSRKRFIDEIERLRGGTMERWFEKWEMSEKDFEALGKGRFSPEANRVVERIAVDSGARYVRTHEILGKKDRTIELRDDEVSEGDE